MFNFPFIIASSSSLLWLLYSLHFTNIKTLLFNSNIIVLYQAIIVLLLPLVLIWLIYLAIKNLNTDHYITESIFFLAKQIKKDTENTILLQQSLTSTEKELEQNFLLNKFDFIISNTNELLSDIIKRSNSISSSQLEHLWGRTASGERWLIAKTFIEISDYQSGFVDHLISKAQKDPLLKGSILEFITHYKNLCKILNKSDEQKIFYDMIEYGSLGKTYQLLNSIADQLYKIPNNNIINKETELKIEKTQKITEEFPSFISKQENLPLKEKTTPIIESSTNAELNSKQHSKEPILKGFTQTQSALQNLEKEYHSLKKHTFSEQNKISLAEIEKEINASPENNYNENDHILEGVFNDKKN